jgi:hypothetical protein
MNADRRDLADLADDLCIAADALRALEAAKPWRCKKRWIAERRINGLARHADALINELYCIFELTGIIEPSKAEVDKYH